MNKVLELAKEAEILRQLSMEVPFVVDRLERFASLIEREVRGDAQPVGYTNEGYKGMQYANAEAYKEIRSDFIERNKLTAPLFAHPAPAVVQPQGWLHAIDEAMVCSHLGVANEFDTYEDAKKKLNTLICWHVDVAIDPTVNGGRKLYPDAVVRQLVEAAERAMNYAENVVMAEGVYFDDDDDLPFIESALLAAKDAGYD